jgi:zinc D-Ala-D-Ala carboxypeptidase
MVEMKKRSVLTILCLLLAALAAGMFLYQSMHPKSTRNSSTLVIPTNKPEPKNVTITLPGAKTINALRQNYSDNSSLWALINKDHPMSNPAYKPADLTLLSTVATRKDKPAEERSLSAVVIPDLENMMKDSRVAGYDLMIASGYRSYALQQHYFDHRVKVSSEATANKYSARPGQSEHQTGLAFDIALTSRQCYLDTCFSKTDAAKWLAVNSYRYGFILRYPADKVGITKYQYEPWHFRYVGKDLAGAIHESKLCLEEAEPHLQKALAEIK